MTARLLQVSGAVIDLIYQVEAVPMPGNEARVFGFDLAPGGGFNAMIAAKRAGMEVSYGGPVGTGPFADIMLHGLAQADIPVLQVRNAELDQGCCTVLIDKSGERTFITSDGAEGAMDPKHLNRVAASNHDWVLLSGYSLNYPDCQAALVDWLMATDVKNLVFDPAPVVQTIPAAAIKAAIDRACWISANATEAGILTGEETPARAAEVLAAGAPPQGGAVVRDGANGCYLCVARQDAQHIPGFSVDAIDTNGAGDTHLGSFIAALSWGASAPDAARYANAAAALSTTRRGPSTAPEKTEVDALLGATCDG
jgi:sugar/nucleoside kinase (ribokinase family)